jgi:hypothetical protein
MFVIDVFETSGLDELGVEQKAFKAEIIAAGLFVLDDQTEELLVGAIGRGGMSELRSPVGRRLFFGPRTRSFSSSPPAVRSACGSHRISSSRVPFPGQTGGIFRLFTIGGRKSPEKLSAETIPVARVILPRAESVATATSLLYTFVNKLVFLDLPERTTLEDK